MGLRDWIWPYNGTNENSLQDNPEQEFEAEPGGGPRHSGPQKNAPETAGMDSSRVDGVMDSADVGEHSTERTVLGTDESTGLDDNHDTPGEADDVHGLNDDGATSGKSIKELLSGNLGEHTVETSDQPDEKTEEESENEEEVGSVNEDRDESTGEERDQPQNDNGFKPETLRSSTPSNGGRHGEHDDTFMELPDACVTESESPDPDASAEEMLPEVLPGWDFQKADRYRWQMDNAEDYINATYRDPQKRRYMFHVSKWKPSHVKYALDELYGFREPHPFDVWAARGQFIFAVKIAGGTVDNAHTLLMACPALSKSYFQIDDEEDLY